MAQKVTLIRTASGEYFIGYKKIEDASNDPANAVRISMAITLTDARNLMPQMTPKGMGISAAPVVPFAIKSPTEITIPKSLVMCEVDEDNIPEGILNGYKSDVSGLDLTTKIDASKIVTPS